MILQKLKILQVETIDFQKNVLDQCDLKQDDEANNVAARIRSVLDLIAAECRYHRSCYKNFFHSNPTLGQRGRPPISDPHFLDSFEKLCEYIDNTDDVCQYDIKHLMNKFHAVSTNTITIDERTLIKKLELRYKSNLKVQLVNGKTTQLYFFVSQQTMRTKSKFEREQIIKSAAEILNFEIRSRNYDFSSHPSLCNDPDRDSMFPELLNLFMTELILNDKKAINRSRLERKVFAIQEIITSNIRERSYVSPLLTNLGIHLHRIYGSKYLHNILHSLGFICSYKEVLNFETSATLAEEPKIALGTFTQMVFDNADINVRTLDGRNTFHAMGGIICASPHDAVSIPETLPRKFTLPAGHKFSTTPIKWFTHPENFNLRSKVISLLKVNEPKSLRMFQRIDTLYLSSMYINKRMESWNGFMARQYNKQNDGYIMTKVLPVPFINLDPGNLHTIHTALRFV